MAERPRKNNWVNQTIDMFTDTDIAWLAGLIDGEGSLVLFKDKRANRGINVHVTVNMVDKETIELTGAMLRYLSGDRVPVREKRPLSGFSRRLQYVVDVCSKRGCLRTLEGLMPYLRTKRLQAELILIILYRALMDLVKRLKRDDGGEARAEAIRILDQVTPSQAALGPAATAGDGAEGLETRRVSPNDNPAHERPAPHRDGDVISIRRVKT